MAGPVDEAALQFLEEHRCATLRVSVDGRVLWANRAASRLVERWDAPVGGVVPRHVMAELASLVAGDSRQQTLLGVADEPVLDAVHTADGTVWLQARVDEDAAVEAIRSQRRSKGTFLANMSHELRTPLNAILGYTELLAEDLHGEPNRAVREDLERVRQSASHLMRLINDILDVSRIEAGRMGLFLETFEVEALIADVVRTVRPLVEGSGNSLRVEQASNLAALRSDRTKLRQVLFNLLDNASKFTEEGTVTLSVDTLDDGVRFTVDDTGVGLPADAAERVFEPFTQVDESTTRTHGGTGLGLALSRLLCELMGGRIEVDPTPPGAAFSVWVPGFHERFPTPISAPRVEEQHGQPQGLVLVIDDDAACRDLLSRYLAQAGHNVITASSGETALQLARAHHPDAITLDVMMPGVDGWEVLRRLKDDPEVRDVPVVMVSIVDGAGLGFSLGAADYLTKPLDKRALLAALRPYTSRGPGTVLVVDDQADARQVMSRTLSRAGWTVALAPGGAQALKWLERNRPDVVLLDLLMPGMDGFQVLERLRAHPAWRTIPVLIVTAKHLSAEEVKQLEGGARGVIEKSGLGMSDLLEALAPYLPQSQRG